MERKRRKVSTNQDSTIGFILGRREYHFAIRHNGLELSRPARALACFSRIPFQAYRFQIALSAGSAAANGYAE